MKVPLREKKEEERQKRKMEKRKKRKKKDQLRTLIKSKPNSKLKLATKLHHLPRTHSCLGRNARSQMLKALREVVMVVGRPRRKGGVMVVIERKAMERRKSKLEWTCEWLCKRTAGGFCAEEAEIGVSSKEECNTIH